MQRGDSVLFVEIHPRMSYELQCRRGKYGSVIAVGTREHADQVQVRFPDLTTWWISINYLKFNEEGNHLTAEQLDKVLKGLQQEHFAMIRANMKDRKITGAQIARETAHSSSQINDILRGNYPWYRAYQLPLYLHLYLLRSGLLVQDINDPNDGAGD